MTLELPRRGFLLGLTSLIAAPAVVRLESLMPVKMYKQGLTLAEFEEYIMQSMVDNLKQQIYDSLIYGSHYSKINGISGLITPIPLKDIYLNDLHSRH